MLASVLFIVLIASNGAYGDSTLRNIKQISRNLSRNDINNQQNGGATRRIICRYRVAHTLGFDGHHFSLGIAGRFTYTWTMSHMQNGFQVKTSENSLENRSEDFRKAEQELALSDNLDTERKLFP